MTQKGIISFLLFRYLRFNKHQPFISIAAILAFLGVCIGVMVLIVAMALMNGFDKEFERKLFIMNYPLTMIQGSPEKITKKFCCGWTPFGIDFLQSKKTSKKQQLALGTMSIG